MRFVLKVSYDGTDFAGWQRQKNALSVQEVLENALFTLTGREIKITGSGRTDAGVHAAGQICHFDDDLLSVPANKLPDALNRFLLPSVRVLEGWTADCSFDSNRSAKRKTYCYSLYESEREIPLKERYAVRVENLPNLEVLKKYAVLFEGEHDFKAFCASGSSVKTTLRKIYSVRIEEEISFGGRDVKIYVTGNGFLYNMVRTLVGELIDLSTERKTVESLQEAFETGKRELLGKTMPAKGLTMISVEYV